MMAFLWLLVVINIVLLIIGAALFVRLKSRLELLGEQADTLVQDIVPATESLKRELKKKAPIVMSIEILNPLELAANESSLAGTLGSLSPNLIRKVVYDRAADIIRTELAEKGVDADVQVIKGAKNSVKKETPVAEKIVKQLVVGENE